MSKLEQNLCDQYGINSCLTNSQLDWRRGEAFRVIADNDTVIQKPHDLMFFDSEKLKRGIRVESLGVCANAFNINGGVNAFLFGVLVKPANDNLTYKLPLQLRHLRDVLSVAAKDFVNTIPYADTYACGLMYRHMPLLATGQIAENWHTHKILTSTTMPPERADNLEIPENMRLSLSESAPDMVAIEYLVSDRVGSHFQTASAVEDLKLSENIGAYTLDDEEAKKFSCRQLIDGELIKGNSYAFHRAAPVPHEMIGENRSLFVISFTPTIHTRLACRP
jgi:hypothetical protein